MHHPLLSALIFAAGAVPVVACCWMAQRSDRRAAGREVVAAAEGLCRAAAADLSAINPEETDRD